MQNLNPNIRINALNVYASTHVIRYRPCLDADNFARVMLNRGAANHHQSYAFNDILIFYYMTLSIMLCTRGRCVQMSWVTYFIWSNVNCNEKNKQMPTPFILTRSHCMREKYVKYVK